MAPPTTADAAEAFVLEKAKEYWEGEDEDGIGLIEHRLILLPIPANDHSFHIQAALLIEDLRQQHASCAEFVLTRGVTPTPRNQNNLLFLSLLFLGRKEERTEKSKDKRQDQGKTFHSWTK